MKSFKHIEQIIGQARLRADPATDGRILSDADAALAKVTSNRPGALQPGPALWRTIMESKVTRYSVAATIILTASLVLLNPFARNSVVLGEAALQKIAATEEVAEPGSDGFDKTVKEAVDSLPPMYREIVVLHYYSELSYRQIESVLGISGDRVKGRLARARKYIQAHLEQEGFHRGQ